MRNRNAKSLAIALASAATLASGSPACQLFSSVSQIPGRIVDDSDEPRFRPAVLSPVDRGALISVTFYTLGGGCIRTAAKTEVDIDGNVAEIRPYDRRDPGNGCCLCDDLVYIAHSATISFPQSGQATVRLAGANVVLRTISVN